MGENTKYLGSCHRIKWGMCCKVDIGGYPVVPLRILLVARGGGGMLGLRVSHGIVMLLACWVANGLHANTDRGVYIRYR